MHSKAKQLIFDIRLREQMIGLSITVNLGEPWDFPHNPLSAKIEKIHTVIITTKKGSKLEEQILIKVNSPFLHDKLKSEYFIASPRYVGEKISELTTKGELIMAIHRITELRAKSDNPFTDKEIRGDNKTWGGIGSFRL